MGLVILRALNRNQMLILSNLNGFERITPLLSGLSERCSVPLSTLKLNAGILRELKLIEFGDSGARLTDFGEVVVSILKDR